MTHLNKMGVFSYPSRFRQSFSHVHSAMMMKIRRIGQHYIELPETVQKQRGSRRFHLCPVPSGDSWQVGVYSFLWDK